MDAAALPNPTRMRPVSWPRAILAFVTDAGMLIVLAGALIGAAWWLHRHQDGADPAGQPLWLMASTFAAMALAALPIWWPMRSLPTDPLPALVAAQWGLGIGLAGFVLGIVRRLLEPHVVGSMPGPSNVAPVLEAFREHPLVAIALVVVVAPWVEEFVMRRVLLGRMLLRGQAHLGLVLTSGLFAWLHEPWPRPDLSIAQWLWLLGGYGLLGALFAWSYLRTRHLIAPFIAHAVNNGFAMAWLVAAH